MKKTRLFSGFIVLAILGAPRFSVALDLNIPSSADVSRVQKEPLSTEVPSARYLELKQPKFEGDIPEGAENVRLTLRSVTIDGSTIYDQEKLALFYKDILGQETTLDQIYKIAHDMTQTYRKDGYVLSQAILPPQDVTD